MTPYMIPLGLITQNLVSKPLIRKFYNQTDTKVAVQNAALCFLGIHEKRRGKKVAKGVPVGLFLLQEKESHRHVASIGLLGAIHI